MKKCSKHSIILPVYNAHDDLLFCIKTIENSCFKHISNEAQPYYKNLNIEVELIIIDDCSNEETKDLIDSFIAKYDSIKLIRHTENKGYLDSVNEGLAASTGDIITLLNSDTAIPIDFTKRIANCFSARREIGIASPILSSGNPFSVPYPKKLSPIDVDLFDENVRNNFSDYPAIIFPDGACFSISRKCFEEIGYFSKEYDKGYFEEMDYCMRAFESAYDTVLIDNLYVYHKSHASFGLQETHKRMKVNGEIFKQKWNKKYSILHKMFPKKEHKKRIFLKFYPYSIYLTGICLFYLIKCIPIPSLRRRLRKKYQ